MLIRWLAPDISAWFPTRSYKAVPRSQARALCKAQSPKKHWRLSRFKAFLLLCIALLCCKRNMDKEQEQGRCGVSLMIGFIQCGKVSLQLRKYTMFRDRFAKETVKDACGARRGIATDCDDGRILIVVVCGFDHPCR